jgi:penicillin-binding protein 1C
LSSPLSKAAAVVWQLATLALLLWLAAAALLRLLPWEGDGAIEQLRFSRVFTDRTGTELFVEPVNGDGLRRLWVPLEAMPDALPEIIRMAEDRRFYFHAGADLPALVRAAFQYLGIAGGDIGGETADGAPPGRVRGASTISMQLASILVPRGTGLPGKLREIVDALQLETRLSKRQIIELYLNLVPMGSNVEGFPAAARQFFGDDLANLTPVQLAMLAVVPRSPSANNPAGADGVPVSALALTLRSGAAGTADEAEVERLLAEEYLRAAVRGPEISWPFLAPHFTRFVAESLPAAGGIPLGDDDGRIVTTLDLEYQKRLESRLAAGVEDSRQYRIGNAAGILVEPTTGEVLAYAGSSDFFDEAAAGQIDGVRILRQPGSTLKPFLYAAALERGFTASSILPDLPLEFGSREIYRPENFNEQYHGPVRLRQALAGSLNIPAVYLLERISVDQFYRELVKVGFTSLEKQRDQLGVSLAVGGADVSLYELAGAFLSFAGDGEIVPLTTVLRGPTAEREADFPPDIPRVWEPSTAALVRDMLSHHEERVMTFGRRSPLKFDFPVYIKTGTSNQFNNIWAVGYSADIGGAIWMGNFSGETVIRAPGSSLPADILHRLISELHRDGSFPDGLGGLTSRLICSTSGMLAHDGCPVSQTEFFVPGTEPGVCDWHDARGVLRYPQQYGPWAVQYGYGLEFQAEGRADIIGPADGALFYLDPLMEAESQQIRLYLTGSGTGRLSINGAVYFAGELPRDVFWPLRPGVFEAVLENGGAEVRRSWEVR